MYYNVYFNEKTVAIKKIKRRTRKNNKKITTLLMPNPNRTVTQTPNPNPNLTLN